MSEPSECAGISGSIFGHNFQPRYDITTNTEKVSSEIISALTERTWDYDSELVDAIEALKSSSSTYIGDVCTRCGTVLERTH